MFKDDLTPEDRQAMEGLNRMRLIWTDSQITTIHHHLHRSSQSLYQHIIPLLHKQDRIHFRVGKYAKLGGNRK